MFTLSVSELKEYAFLKGFDINFSDYFVVNNIADDLTDPLLHYVKNWQESNLVIPNEFNTYEYLHEATDVLESGENPLVHYLSVGIHEGRAPQLKEAMDDSSFFNIHTVLSNNSESKKEPEFKITLDQLSLYVQVLHQVLIHTL